MRQHRDCHGTTLDKTDQEALNALTGRTIGCAIEVHKALGPGLLESAYDDCLCHELSLSGVQFKRKVPVPVSYKGIKLDSGYQLDILVEDLVIVELKSVDSLLPVHEAQLLTYLKLTAKPVGLLVNFNVSVLTKGIKRMVL